MRKHAAGTSISLDFRGLASSMFVSVPTKTWQVVAGRTIAILDRHATTAAFRLLSVLCFAPGCVTLGMRAREAM